MASVRRMLRLLLFGSVVSAEAEGQRRHSVIRFCYSGRRRTYCRTIARRQYGEHHALIRFVGDMRGHGRKRGH